MVEHEIQMQINKWGGDEKELKGQKQMEDEVKKTKNILHLVMGDESQGHLIETEN
jgi:hypothetical protein